MRDRRWVVQMGLFQQLRPTTPQWRDLPPEVRLQALPLLARLLRMHRRDHLVDRRGREAGDE